MVKSIMSEDKESFNTQEISEILNVHPETIRRMIRDGEIAAEREGREYRISREEKNRLIKSNLPTVRTVLSHLRFVIDMYQNELQVAEKSFEKWDGVNSLYYLERFKEIRDARSELQKLEYSLFDLIRIGKIHLDDPYDIKKALPGYFLPLGV